MKNYIFIFLVLFGTFIPIKSKADFWGGDLVYLAQILENAIKQYAELKNIVETNKNQLDLLTEINRGINDSLNLARTINPNIDPGIYKDWINITDALVQMKNLYGVVTNSPLKQIYSDTDLSAAEAITLNNDVYKYTENIDRLSEVIKEISHDVSPGGAQKLTAQTLGVILQVMNQNLRTQATGLKLQAQTMALNNKKEKDSTQKFLDTANVLKNAMKHEPAGFKSPRF